MKRTGGHADDPTLTPDQVTEPAARDSEPVLLQDLPGYQLGDVIGRGGMGEVVIGVIERTWWMTPEGLLTKGTILHTPREADVFILALGQAALACVVGFFSTSTTRAREEAQRRAHVQAWHLQQLIPKAAQHAISSPG